jgi:hypothetical protein
MALHFLLTLLDGVDSPHFPTSGLSWEQFVQLLTNILGIFKLAIQSQSLSGIVWRHAPFLLCVESLLHLISNNEIKLAWTVRPHNYMVAVYKLLESLLLLFTKWHFCLKSNITCAEIVDQGPLACTVLRLCPDVTFHPLVGDIVQLAQDWKWQAINLLGPERHMSYYLNPMTDLPGKLFQSGIRSDKHSSTAIESSLKPPARRSKPAPPTSSGVASHPAPASTPTSALPGSSQAATATIPTQPKTFAAKPIMQWTASGSHASFTPGKVLMNLMTLVLNLKPSLSLLSTGAGLSVQICLPFSCGSYQSDCGCDQQQMNSRTHSKYEPCQHVDLNDAHSKYGPCQHVDLNDATWQGYGKSIYQPLWDWLQHQAKFMHCFDG